jgi:phytoene dehydrogenase-like protein
MTDAIVIGSGPNGLAAAIRLAGAGREVVVLEASDVAGGALRTEELTLPGFHHDVFSAVHPAAAASPVFAAMPLADHGLEWVHPEVCVAHPLPGGEAGALHRDADATARSLDALRAGDGQRWSDFVRPYLEASDAVRETMLSGFPPIRGPIRLLRDAGPVRTLAFTRQLPESAVSLGERLFRSDHARAWLYGGALHGDVPPQGRGSAIAAFYLYLFGHAVGWPSPRGGAGRLAAALAGHLESLGGTIRTGVRVTEITSAGGRVTGVRTDDGEALPAPVVVATIMPRDLVRLSGDGLPAWFRRVMRRYRYGQGTVKVDWALDGPIPWENESVRTAGTVHVAGTEPEFLRAIDDAHHTLPERPFLLLGQQSLADPSRAPEGRHTAWAYTHAPTRLLDAAAPCGAHVERMEAQVERFAPGFRDLIAARHVLAPGELEARNANLIGGDVGGGSYSLDQIVFRPRPGLNPYRTPLRGLVLGSAAAFPGGAVHGVPGDAAARAVLRQVRC